MRTITHTTQDRNTGVPQWERFTLKGIEDHAKPLAAFATHYMLNMIPRG